MPNELGSIWAYFSIIEITLWLISCPAESEFITSSRADPGFPVGGGGCDLDPPVSKLEILSYFAQVYTVYIILSILQTNCIGLFSYIKMPHV